MTQLLIVESPAKANTIHKMLGPGWRVEASKGHIRDLPDRELGINLETFQPTYVPTERGADILMRLRYALRQCDSVYLATDPDREGEAIAWHIAEALQLRPAQIQRVTYHEITETAIRKAIASPRRLDMRLVAAQEARRVLDRLIGYEGSSALRKGAKGPTDAVKLAMGRVQTPALRLVVERERAIAGFKSVEHYGAVLSFRQPAPFDAEWITQPFHRSASEPYVLDEALAARAAAIRKVRVQSIQASDRDQRPWPPFTTSTLQQAASIQLGFSPTRTMELAQALFEEHHAITYHRTDSVQLADEAIRAIRAYAKRKGYPLPDQPLRHVSKVKNAQEAHEAIRPTDVEDEQPEGLCDHALKLYQLIHQQAVRSQLRPSRIRTTRVTLFNTATRAERENSFQYLAQSVRVIEPGHTVLDEEPIEESTLPALSEGMTVDAHSGEVTTSRTKAPARFTEASLIAELDRQGIGRPSTWASTIKKIRDHEYIALQGKQLYATNLGVALIDAVADMRFSQYDYTAKLEDRLDTLSKGSARFSDVVGEWWHDVSADMSTVLKPMRIPADFAAHAGSAKSRGKRPSSTGQSRRRRGS